MSKRRKWPLKGWHKRFFVMEQGVLTYGKTKTDIIRGRTLGENDYMQQYLPTYELHTQVVNIDALPTDVHRACLLKYVF